MAFLPSSNSVVAFQSQTDKLIATIAGSVAAVLGPTSIATLQGTNPWTVQLTSGSVLTTVGNSSVMLTSGTNTIGSVTTLQGTNPWIVQLTSGSVITTGGNSSVQVVGILPPTSVSGVGQFNVNHTGNGSVLTVSLGSIATAPSPASVSGVGLFNVNHTGVGSIFTAFRNDAVASTVGVDLTSRLIATDSAGRQIVKPFAATEAYITGVSSTVNTNPSSLVSGAGAGLRNYLTDVFITNTGSVATLVSFRDGDASIIAKTIAPAGGGSNLIGMATPFRTGGFNQPIEFTAGTATSILHVTAMGYKAP